MSGIHHYKRHKPYQKHCCQKKQKAEPHKKKSCSKSKGLLELLKRLQKSNGQITVIINSGVDCCSHTGCIAEIDDGILTLLAATEVNNGCQRIYIPIDCICAIIDPAEDINEGSG